MKTGSVIVSLLTFILIGVGSGPTLALEEPVQVTVGGGSEPAVSPDGLWMLYRAPSVGVCRVSTSGGLPDTLEVTGLEPDWSPSGDAFLYRYGGLHIYEIASATSWQLHDGVGWDDGPAWSPLGDEIVVQGEPVKLISYPDGILSTVTCQEPAGGGCAGEFPAWSPDGQWIAFQDGTEILKVHRDGGAAQVVVSGVGLASEPAWSPDGKWIVFTTAVTYPQFNIWVSDARGTEFGLAQLTTGDFKDWSPEWSPDSGSIYFSSDRSGTREIWVIPFDTQVAVEKQSMGSVKALFR